MNKIFESPDGGKTIYERQINEYDYFSRQQEIRNNMKEASKQVRDNLLWWEIRQLAKENEGLQDILNQAIILYNLLKERN